MKTSYFSRYKEPNGVSVAVGTPNWFKGKQYPDLFPTWEMLNKLKEDGNEEEFIRAYHEEVLTKLDPEKVYTDLKNKVILCWESSEKFCHRHVIADWLNSELDIDIDEHF